ncbi:MAG: GNAT family N-acetyltransferase [Clostridia bacterium]|nr:GNAT family N-acetyltransferase [Clostridia bacterium]
MSSPVTIRPMTAEDAAPLGEIYVESWRGTYAGLLPAEMLASLSPAAMAEKWLAYAEEPGHTVLVAREGAQLLGFGASMPDKEREELVYLDSLHVAPAARGKGVGTALIRALAALADQAGCTGMSVSIVRGNDRTRALYTRLGAQHDRFFEDDLYGARSDSERLVWPSLADLCGSSAKA